MNAWMGAAIALILCLIPCGFACARGELIDRIVALELSGLIVTLVLILLAESFHRPPFMDLALALALLAFGGGLVFVRFFERWM